MSDVRGEAREVRGLAAAGGGFSVGLSLLGVVVCTASVFFSSWQGFSVFVWFWTITAGCSAEPLCIFGKLGMTSGQR